MSEESFTITDNRSGESVTVPIVDGTISSAALRELDKGMWFYDPAYMSTANCNSKITYIAVSYTHLTLPTNREV